MQCLAAMWKWNKRKFLCWLTKQDWLQMLTYELVLLIRKMSPKRSLLWLIVRPKKKMCVYDCMVFKIRIGRFAPSKITQTCLFVSYYSLLIIWHAVQCFWFQTSIKCTRKWRKLLKSETNTETETNFRILPIYFSFGI